MSKFGFRTQFLIYLELIRLYPWTKKKPSSRNKELSFTLDIYDEEIAVVSYEPDDEVKEKKNITLTTEVIPFYLEKLDAIAADNQGHLALGRVCKQNSSLQQLFLCVPNFLYFSLFCLTVDLGWHLLCRYFGLPQLHGKNRFNWKIPELESSCERCERIGANQSMAGKETTNRCLNIIHTYIWWQPRPILTTIYFILNKKK